MMLGVLVNVRPPCPFASSPSSSLASGIVAVKVHLAGKFGQQRRQDIFLVAPDQPIAPGLVALQGGEEAAALAGAFVHGLDGLKRQRGPKYRRALGALGIQVLAVPDQFGFRHGRNPGTGVRIKGVAIAGISYQRVARMQRRLWASSKRQSC